MKRKWNVVMVLVMAMICLVGCSKKQDGKVNTDVQPEVVDQVGVVTPESTEVIEATEVAEVVAPVETEDEKRARENSEKIEKLKAYVETYKTKEPTFDEYMIRDVEQGGTREDQYRANLIAMEISDDDPLLLSNCDPKYINMNNYLPSDDQMRKEADKPFADLNDPQTYMRYATAIVNEKRIVAAFRTLNDELGLGTIEFVKWTGNAAIARIQLKATPFVISKLGDITVNDIPVDTNVYLFCTTNDGSILFQNATLTTLDYDNYPAMQQFETDWQKSVKIDRSILDGVTPDEALRKVGSDQLLSFNGYIYIPVVRDDALKNIPTSVYK